MALPGFQFTVQDEAGNIIVGASVRVTLEADGSLPALYSDPDGLTPIGNPILSDADGWVYFHVVAGVYKIRVTSGDFERIFRYVGLGTAVADGVTPGIKMVYSVTTTDADPGAGLFRLNNAAPASVTAAYIDNVDLEGATVSAVLDTWDDTGDTTNRGYLEFRCIDDPEIFALYKVTGSVVDGTGYRKLTLVYVAHNSTLAGQFALSFARSGQSGITSAVRQTYSSTTTDADPGAGTFRLNNATLASVTAAYVDNVDADGNTVSAWFDTFDDVGASASRGTLTIRQISDASKFAIYTVTGSVVDGTGYRKLTLAHVASNGALSGTCALSFAGAGPTGATGAGGTGGAPTLPQGRLTLQTATPVMTTTQSAKTTVYYTPYQGRFIPLWDGVSSFSMTDTGGELSQATTDSTKSPAAVTTNSNYDVFGWSDGGTIRATRGPLWSSSTARGTGAGTTELEMVNGILVNKNAITNGPAARMGTYLGTIRTNGSSQVDWIIGGSAAGGTAAVFGVWNAYNRVETYGLVQDSGTSWTYASATPRPANNSSTMRASFVSGLAEDLASAQYYCIAAGGTVSDAGILGVGYDVTNAFSGQPAYCARLNAPSSGVANYSTTALGFHFMSACEASNSTGTITFYGSGSGSIFANAFSFKFKM